MSAIQKPIILEGQPFDWEAGKQNMQQVVRPDGTLDMSAAMGADPGVAKCPRCGIYLWREGTKVECPECHFVFMIK